MERISAETIMLDVSGVGSGYYVLEVLGTGYPVLIHKP
jgi:hypothetical protein